MFYAVTEDGIAAAEDITVRVDDDDDDDAAKKKKQQNKNKNNSGGSSSSSSTAVVVSGTVSAAKSRLDALIQTALVSNAFARAVKTSGSRDARKRSYFAMPRGWSKTITEDGDVCFVKDEDGSALWILWHQVSTPSTTGNGDSGGREEWWDRNSEKVYYERPSIADDDTAAAIVDSNGERVFLVDMQQQGAGNAGAGAGAGGEGHSAADLDLAEAVAQIGVALFSQGEQLREVFVSMDLDGNGLVDLDEFQSALDGLGLGFTTEQVNEIFRLIDDNDSGSINFVEFFAAFQGAAEYAGAAAAEQEVAVSNTDDGGAGLPDGWQAITDESGDDTYCYNAGTGEAVWEKPTA